MIKGNPKKRVVHTKFDIYVLITITGRYWWTIGLREYHPHINQ